MSGSRKIRVCIAGVTGWTGSLLAAKIAGDTSASLSWWARSRAGPRVRI